MIVFATSGAATEFDSTPALGIALAVLSAAVLSVGNIWQSRGMETAVKRKGDGSLVVAMVKTPIWLAGTVMFGLAILLQMASLAFAPLMVVQPIGILALVFAVFLNARAEKRRPARGVLVAVLICLVGVTGYVIVAAAVSTQKAISDGQLIAVLSTLAAVLVIAGIVRLVNRGAAPRAPLMYVLLGAVFSSFVATLGKTVILRVQGLFAGHHFSLDSGGALTILCVLGIGAAAGLSIYYVQTAYTKNPSDVVVAGLTVIDPAIAVLLGIVILNEAAGAPPWSIALIAVAGAIAVFGVVKLARAENPPSDAVTGDSDAIRDPAAN